MDGAALWESCSRQSTEVLGYAENEPTAQNSCVQRTLEVLNLISAEAQGFKQNFFPTYCLSALLLSLFTIHLRSHDLHTRDTEES